MLSLCFYTLTNSANSANYCIVLSTLILCSCVLEIISGLFEFVGNFLVIELILGNYINLNWLRDCWG